MPITAEAKKRRIIMDLIETRRKILDVASTLSPAQQDDVFLGVWSAKDFLAHLAGWDYANLEAARDILAGRVPEFYKHYDRDWRTFNARLVAEYKRDDFADLLRSVEESQHELIAFLERVPAQGFFQDRGVRFKGCKVTVAALLRVEADDEKKHHGQLVEFRDGSSA